jgi:hypothetical protein
MSYEVSVADQPRCDAQRREVTGERWEVHGDWQEDSARLETMVFCRLRQAAPDDA